MNTVHALATIALGVVFFFHRKATMATLETLRRELAETRAGIDSVLALVAGLRQQLQDLIDADTVTPEALQELVDEMDRQQADLAAATVTDPAPAPTPVDPTTPTNPAETPPAVDPSEPGNADTLRNNFRS